MAEGKGTKQTEQKARKGRFHLQHWQVVNLYLIAYDIVAVNAAYFLALLLRFDFRYSMIPEEFLTRWRQFTPAYTVLCLVVFWLLRLYKSLWRFASYNELIHITASSAITCLIQVAGTLLFVGRMPISYYIGGAVFQFLFVMGVRFSYRFVLLLRESRRTGKLKNQRHVDNVMLIGAGNAGQMILRDFKRSAEISDNVVCFIDDNPNKKGRYIDGIPVVGGRDDIFSAVDKYHIQKIYLTIPSASAADKRDILNICKDTGCQLKILPGIYQLADGNVKLNQMEDVSVEDLLGREPVKTDLTAVFDFVHGKRVMITGAGGSIGSELARQIASHQPDLLLLVDFYENNVYQIQLELRSAYPDLNMVVLIGSVRDSRRMNEIFDKYRPQIVYHAAAHKHVPLMEDSPCEAIKNNAIGTYKTAYAAMTHGAERFVLISTDKAVNPTNIMGASKRLCEMIIQSFDEKIQQGQARQIPRLFTHWEKNMASGPVSAAGMSSGTASTASTSSEAASMGAMASGAASLGGMPSEAMSSGAMPSAAMFSGADGESDSASSISSLDRDGDALAQTKTRFVAVRFGNVLGSNGSVIPIFKQQIAHHQPVTVTHPDIIRYFMTIPEAVSLVLLAGTYAKGGEIFVLDMGSPVKIDTLARNLIKLSGYKPDVDIPILYTGLRPGEKLYEEKLMEEEGLKKTDNDLIFVGAPVPFDSDQFLKQLGQLMQVAYSNDEEHMKRCVAQVVTTYHQADQVNKEGIKVG